MRKVQVVSDLHVETRPQMRSLLWVNPEADIVIIAGDACDYKDKHRLRDMFEADTFKGKEVIYVPGNHEFYRAPDVDLVVPELTGMMKVVSTAPVRVSYKTTHMIDGTFYICATLWSDLSNPMSAMYGVTSLNDFRVPGLTSEWYNAQHQEHKKFIRESLGYAKYHGYKSVVVTHHCPSKQSTAEEYIGDPLNDCFSSDLDDMMFGDDAPAVWIHGHTHHSFSYTLGKTQVICNPYGYPNEGSGQGFNRNLLLEI